MRAILDPTGLAVSVEEPAIHIMIDMHTKIGELTLRMII
jgi:hypothetical protein